MSKRIVAIATVILIIVGIFTVGISTKSTGIKLKQYNDLPYALCAASGTRPLNQYTVINGVKYRLGLSECPIITTGASFANTDLTNGKLTPDGTLATVWSLFGVPSTFPIKQTDGSWINMTPVHRNFKNTKTPGGGSSNQWSFPCVVEPRLLTATDGTTFRVAICKGPMMENINNKPIKFGTRTWTEAPDGIPNPIVAQILSNS